MPSKTIHAAIGALSFASSIWADLQWQRAKEPIDMIGNEYGSF